MAVASWERLIVLAPAFLLAISFHEFAHAWMAVRFGDPSPRYAGRLTLNPLAHLDFLGTVMLLLVGIGFAKPVQVDPTRFRRPIVDMMWVALAGPASNIILAVAAALLLRMSALPLGLWLERFLVQSVWLNIALACFNLLPIPPLDGSRIIRPFVSWRARMLLAQLESYGFLIILLLSYTGILSALVFRPAFVISRLLLG